MEVSKEGNTTSRVFRGSVKVQILPSPAGRGAGGEDSVVLKADESARVEATKDAAVLHLIVGADVGVPPKFVRRIYQPPKLLDMLDIVAGGDGSGNRRGSGIDPTTGKQDTYYVPAQHRHEHRYHRVTWNRLIDGVFIPDGRAGAVRLDSAGHTFAKFGELTEGMTVGCIWARGGTRHLRQKSKSLGVDLFHGPRRGVHARGTRAARLPCRHRNHVRPSSDAGKIRRRTGRHDSGRLREWPMLLSYIPNRTARPTSGCSSTAG